jgi:hypothetical protein
MLDGNEGVKPIQTKVHGGHWSRSLLVPFSSSFSSSSSKPSVRQIEDEDENEDKDDQRSDLITCFLSPPLPEEEEDPAANALDTPNRFFPS